MDYFNLKFHNTTVKNEIFAGIAMFMAMSYILVVCPTVLSEAGMDYNSIFFATALASGVATIISAVYTKLPLALAPALSIAGIFLQFATGPKQVHFSILLMAVYVTGIVVYGLVKFGIYDKVMVMMDADFRRMLMAGLGLALFLYGISTTGILKKQDNLYVIGEVKTVPIVICCISLFLIYLFKSLKVKGHVIVGLLAAYLMSLNSSYYDAYLVTGVSVSDYIKEVFAISYNFSSVGKTMLSFPNIIDFLGNGQNLLLFGNVVFAFTMGHFFGAIGSSTASYDSLYDEMDLRVKKTIRLKRAIQVNGVGGIISGLTGTSSVITYAESVVGIMSGGRTGITALTTGILFLLSIFFAPLFTSMTSYVAAPALIYVGVNLMLKYKAVTKEKKVVFIFGLLLIIYTGVTFNIGNAVLYGLIIYTIIKMVMEKEKPVPKWWILFLLAMIHMLLSI